MTYDVFWVICVQVQDDERSERFILASADPQLPPESMNVSLPLIESDIRRELEKSGLRVEQVESYIQHARAFKTQTTSNEFWAAAFGKHRS
jgi:hypothetical protein